MVKETWHALGTDPNAELADGSRHGLVGVLALVVILILLAVSGWSLYDWNPEKAARAAAVASPTQMEKR
jgi:hypothetical protein